MKLIYTHIKKSFGFLRTPDAASSFTAPVLLILILACTDFVTVDPPRTQVVSETVFIDDATAASAIRGIYSKMITVNSNFADGGGNSVTAISGLTADEFINYLNNPVSQNFYANSILPSNSIILWQAPYQYIYYANSVLEGLEKSTSVSSATKNQLTGEAKFIRAFCHFYLVNLYGDVPIVTTTDYRVNSVIARSPASSVYAQIIADLKDAQSLLATDFSVSAGERIRPNKWAATALLARAYLYTDDWANAEAQASMVISNSLFSLVPNLNNVFLKNSTEAIWQLMPVVSPYTPEGSIFISTTTPQYISLRPELLNAFEAGDKRRTSWVSSVTISANTFYFPFKYKIKSTTATISEYYMVLRLAEQYLVRAEARAQQSNVVGAQADLNAIRVRAGLANTTAADKASLLLAVEKERRIELFAEWGHRWMDLKRTNRADAVLSVSKAPNWQPTDVLYPIPQSERSNDVNLTQNEGYN